MPGKAAWTSDIVPPLEKHSLAMLAKDVTGQIFMNRFSFCACRQELQLASLLPIPERCLS